MTSSFLLLLLVILFIFLSRSVAWHGSLNDTQHVLHKNVFLYGKFLSDAQNVLQSTGFTPVLPAFKDTTIEYIQAGCVNTQNDCQHIPKLGTGEPSGRQVETSQKMQREVRELQAEDVVYPVIKSGTCGLEHPTKKGKKGTRGNMKNQSTRHVALRIMYWGSRYQGFAFQPGSLLTVESELFAALRRTKLLIGDLTDANYSRCGRTDKGVSAVGQLVSLRLRTSCRTLVHKGESGGPVDTYENFVDEDEKIISSAAHDVEVEEMLTDRVAAARASRGAEESVSSNLGDEEEIDYVGVLNRVLPDDIRVLGWCPVPSGFHSRFSCLYREYKYFFVGGNLDIASMKLAASKFLGENDFRNFCKMDAANVHNYRRTVTELEIVPFNEGWAGRQVWVVRVKGTAFLWHQIRCMVAVLFMVGRGYEPPEIVDNLLAHASNTSRKPQYSMASEIPLVLRRCGFQGLTLHCPPKAMKHLKLHLEKYLEQALIHVSLIQEALEELPSSEILDMEHINKLKRMHIPLSLRQTEPSYEERRTRSDA